MPLTNIAGTPTLDDLAGQAPASAPAAAPLDFFDKVKLGWKADQARPSWGFNETNWKNSALAEIEDGLRKKGVKLGYSLMDHDSIARAFPPAAGQRSEDRAYQDALGKVHMYQLLDPSFLPDFGSVVDKRSFDQLVLGRQRRQAEDVERQAPDGLGLGGFLGGLGHGSLDPINYLPIGGEAVQTVSVGRRILQNGLRWGAVNVGVTAATEPFVRQNAERLGIERTNSDFGIDLLGAGTLGFLLGGPGAEAARFGKGKFVELLQRRAEAKSNTAFDSFDSRVAEAFKELVPEGERTPDETAALHAIEREAEVKATSPFVEGPAGEDAHAAALDRGMEAVTRPETLPQRGAVKPIDRATVAGPADVAATRMPARELVKAKIHRAETSPKDDYNETSGAMGPYQFLASTWVSLFKRRYPGDKRSFGEIAALRRDPHLNDVLINDLMSENAAALRHGGFEPTAGNLYLAHVLGHDRAVTVLRAGPDAKLADLLPRNYFKGNPFRPTDSAGSLIHWAYGKMGDDGVPVHVASPEIAQASEAIRAGEGDPLVELNPGRFDVEALYGDVAMTDRPVLNPDHFASPEEHAAAQLRFERASDAADGYAPVMSRAEAFAPVEHYDALKAYRGKVTAEAIGEALGLSPGEVRQVVGSMQATDANSPYMLTRGRPPKLDKMGNVVREGTEAGRVIRRPKLPSKAETLVEFLSRSGGLNDVGGDLRAMDAHLWHKGGRFRRQLLQDEGMAIDDAFERAIEAGYFPEHAATRMGGGGYDDLPDTADFLAAIDEELRGNPRHAVHDLAEAERIARERRYDPDEEAAFAEHFDPKRMTPEERSQFISDDDYAFLQRSVAERGFEAGDDVLIDAAARFHAGQDLDAAIEGALMADMMRDLEDFAALSGEMRYEPSDELAAHIGEFPEERGDYGAGGEDGAGGGRSAAAESGAGEGGNALEEPAHDPAAGEFADPVGPAAEAQADGAIHDLQMEAGPSRVFHGGNLTGEIRAPLFVAEDRAMADSYALDRGGQVTELSIAPRKVATKHDIDAAAEAVGVDPHAAKTMTGGMLLDANFNERAAPLIQRLREQGFDAAKFDDFAVDADSKTGTAYAVLDPEIVTPEGAMFRLDEEGGESDLASILDEIEAAQRANDEMRNCLKPMGATE